MNDAKLKGISLVHLHDFLVEKHGEQAVEKVSAAVSASAAKALKQPNAADWYPLVDLVEIERTIAEQFHGGDYSMGAQIGAYDMERSVGQVYRFFFQFLEPTFLIKRTAKMWNTMISHGRCEIELTDPKHAVVRIFDLDPSHRVYCHDMRGSLTGALAACGIKTAVVEHTECVLDGKPACRFDASW